MNTERIICAAIWYKDLPTQNHVARNQDKGLLICGHRHGHCIDVVKSLAGLRTVSFGPDSVGETVQGFLTNTNRFVDREEGWLIAESANQIIQQSGGHGTLYSEDLY
jgi:hypothetical protein